MAREGLAAVLVFLAGCALAPPPAPRAAEALGAAKAAETASSAEAADPGAPAAADPLAAAGAEPADAAGAADADEPDDGLELAPADQDAAGPAISPLAAMTDAQIEERFKADPASLGSMSLGSARAGLLVNGVQMPEDDAWVLIDRAHAWGTQETVDYLARAIQAVRRQIPDTPRISIGHISGKNGGHLSPHISHQGGRDVDVGYYLSDGRSGFRRAAASNLDRERTWALVRALITETDVELILIDSGVQRLLKAHALQAGEDAAWLDEIFQVGSRSPRPLIRHAKGHANHLHVRFYNPVAQASGARAYPALVKLGKLRRSVSSNVQYVRHVARPGHTLGWMAKRYGTTVEAIQKANGMRSTHVQA
ncbi:MAG: penicillin-insensitive murein endopeptidase [Polyangiaceae bacterium]|nr:penicillin-insensitive murein endopeptidase [Polyangiaceae bacterium]